MVNLAKVQRDQSQLRNKVQARHLQVLQFKELTRYKALPADLTLITVTGTFVDFLGAPLTGTVTWAPQYTNVFIDKAHNVLIMPLSFTATLDGSGSISQALPATDDPDILPVGWSYLVTYLFNSGTFKESFSMVLPYDTVGGTIDLSDVNPVNPTVGLDAFVTLGELDTLIDEEIDGGSF